MPFSPNPGPGNFVLGDTIQWQYNVAGEYTVMHAINDGVCSYDTSYFNVIIVFPNPVSDFTPINGCLNDTITFVNTSYLDTNIISQPTSISGYNWYVDGVLVSVSDINLNYSFNTIGNHTVSLVTYTDRGCFDSTAYNIEVYPLPIADFTTDTVCYNNLTNFLNSSQTGANNSAITTWEWNFGDINSPNNNLSSTTANPIHSYTNHGVFYTTLIIEDNLGCRDSVTNPVRVWNNPTASFITDSICQGAATNFIGTSSPGDGSITSWTWNFGDFSSSVTETDSLTTHVYPNSGEFYATLLVNDEFGCFDDFSDSVRVWALPIVSFSSSINCQGDTTIFNNNSIVTDADTIVSYFWNFGDVNSGPLNSSTSQNPSHLYTDCGIFSTTLNIVDNLGCIGSNQSFTEVICNPTAEFTVYDTICDGDVTNFANLSSSNSTNPSIFINQFNWNISPGTYINSSDSSANPSFLFDTCSTSFSAELIVELNQYGCKDTVLHEVTVYCNPDADFVSSVGCEGTPIQFTDESILGDTLIEFWSWSELNIPFSSNQNPVNILSNTGLVPVKLVITDFFGCVDSLIQNVTVYNSPNVDFNIIPDTICGDDPTVTLEDLSTQSNFPSNLLNFGIGILEMEILLILIQMMMLIIHIPQLIHFMEKYLFLF